MADLISQKLADGLGVKQDLTPQEVSEIRQTHPMPKHFIDGFPLFNLIHINNQGHFNRDVHISRTHQIAEQMTPNIQQHPMTLGSSITKQAQVLQNELSRPSMMPSYIMRPAMQQSQVSLVQQPLQSPIEMQLYGQKQNKQQRPTHMSTQPQPTIQTRYQQQPRQPQYTYQRSTPQYVQQPQMQYQQPNYAGQYVQPSPQVQPTQINLTQQQQIQRQRQQNLQQSQKLAKMQREIKRMQQNQAQR